MTTIKAKGHEFKLKVTTSGYGRKAVQYANNIVDTLKKLNLTRDDVEVETNILGNKNYPASASWYYKDEYLYYSYSKAKRFIDNLFVVAKVIELEVEKVVNKEKTSEEFIKEFAEQEDIQEMRKQARELLGVDPKETDLESIDKKYKELAKKHHPDAGGDLEMFKNINKAHKTLKRELE